MYVCMYVCMYVLLNVVTIRFSGDNRLAALKKLPRVRRSETSRRHRRKRGWWKRLGCWLFGCSPPAGELFVLYWLKPR